MILREEQDFFPHHDVVADPHAGGQLRAHADAGVGAQPNASAVSDEGQVLDVRVGPAVFEEPSAAPAA